MTTMSNSNASCFRVGLSWVELRWVLTKVEVKIAKGNPEVFEKNLPVVDKVSVTVAAGKIKKNASTHGNDVDTIVKNANIFDMNDMMYKQVHGGETYEDRVDSDKGMDALKIIPLLQAILIFATLFFNHKSQLSQSSLHSYTKPKVSMFPSSPCSCQIQSRLCCEVTTAITGKVSSVVSTVSAVVAWLKQTCIAFCSAGRENEDEKLLWIG